MSAGAGKVGFLTHLSEGELYWSAFATDEAVAASGLDKSAYPDVREYLLAQFEDVYKLQPVLQSTPAEQILERRVADRVPLVDESGAAKIPWAASEATGGERLPVTLLFIMPSRCSSLLISGAVECLHHPTCPLKNGWSCEIISVTSWSDGESRMRPLSLLNLSMAVQTLFFALIPIARWGQIR